MKKDNFTQVLKLFVRALNIPITYRSIESELKMHPEYNSFVALSDVLNNWRVPNAAYQLTFDELLGAEIEDPFIAFVSDKEFVLVSQINKDFAIVSNERWNNHKLTLQQFQEIYSGSILVAEKEETSGEHDYKKNRKKEVYDRIVTPAIYAAGLISLVAVLLIYSGLFNKLIITWISLIVCVLIIIAIWMLGKNYWLLAKKQEAVNAELYNFKYNREVFQASLNESAKYRLVDDSSIVLGNPQAENILTVVLKPYGNLSAEAYKGLSWVAGRDDLKLQVIFGTSGNDPDAQVATHILALKEKQGHTLLIKALDDWFGQKSKNYDTWADVWPIYKSDKAKEVLKTHSDWCQMVGVNKIPAIFINGKKLNLNYKTSDLKYFI